LIPSQQPHNLERTIKAAAAAAHTKKRVFPDINSRHAKHEKEKKKGNLATTNPVN